MHCFDENDLKLVGLLIYFEERIACKSDDMDGKLLPAVNGAMDCGQKSFKQVWRCHQLMSGFLPKATCSECHVCQLMIRMIMR